MAAVGFANPYIGAASGDDVVLKRINKRFGTNNITALEKGYVLRDRVRKA